MTKMIEVGVVPLDDWPARHRQLREAGVRPPLLRGDPSGAGAKWRAQTIKGVDACWGRALHFARQMGWHDINDTPEAIASADRLSLYLAHLGEHNRPATVLNRVIGLERALALLASSYDRKLLRLLIANLEDDYDPISKRERLQEAAALIELGIEIMKTYGTANVARRRQTTFRDGLQIALLASRPVRLTNFRGMQIGPGGHLDTTGDTWKMQWQKHEMKNNKAFEVEFPRDLMPAMQEYLSRHRKELCGNRYEGDALWISYHYYQQSEVSIRENLKAWTTEAFGLPITPHLFRDCAATSLAVHAPEEVQIAHLILGNTYAVMQKHYNLARVIDAGRHYHDALDRLCIALSDA